jgi:hypothetical protein
MLLITHISIAILSLLATSYTFFVPSRAKLHTSYGLTAATIISGTYLVISTHSPLLSSCVTGLVYLGIVTAGLIAAHRKLSTD